MDQQETQTPTPAPTTTGEKKDHTKLIVIVVVVLVALYAVQQFLSPARMVERSVERAMERAGGGDVDIDINPRGNNGDASVTFKGKDGESYEMNAGGNVSLPDTWPKSVPLIGDAEITYAGTMMAAQGGGTSVAYTTRQSVSEVADYYKGELPKSGWTIAMTSATADGAVVTATRNENESVMVYVGSSPEGTTVTMTVQAAN